MRTTTASLIAVFLISPRAGSAEPETRSSSPAIEERATRWHPSLALELQGGPGNPMGTVAFALDYATSRWFSLNAGVGVDLAGVQAGIAPRVRLPLDADASHSLFVSGGAAVGNFCRSNRVRCQVDDDGQWAYRVSPAFWGDGSAGWEHRSMSGVSFRAGVGVGILVNKSAAECDSLGSPRLCNGAFGRVAPFLTLAVGEAF